MINLFRQESGEQSAQQTLDPGHRGVATEQRADASHSETVETLETLETIDVESIAAQLAARPRALRTRGDCARMAASLACLVTFAACLSHGEILFAMLSLSVLCTLRFFNSQFKRQRRMQATLQGSQLDRRRIGPLAEALEWPNRRVQAGAAALLKQQLPQLDSADAVLFTEEQCHCLYRRLRRRAALADPELALTILHALPSIGTEPALSPVEQLAKRTAYNGKTRRLRDAARATLAPLERHIAQQRMLQPAVISLASPSVETTPEDVLDGALVTENSAGSGLAEASERVDAQIHEFEQELRRLQKPGMRLGFLIASWGIILPYCAVQTYLQFAAGQRANGLIFCLLTLLSTQLHRLTLTDQHRLLARKLSKLDDIRCVGRLVEALEWPDATVRRLTITALTGLLPRIAASDAALLTARHRGVLNHMLILDNAAKHTEFVCAILKALEQIGDESSVSSVEQMMKIQPTSSRMRRVRDAARDCLPFLQARAALNQSSQTLLRASSATVTGGEMLVRPANGANSRHEEQLLRPGPAAD